ncbi:Ig-like domain-containing protein [Variovorax paradoxus]|uniref:Ig-like domain-containing protein n=1 Tax=Variovorax paradoxus TaxID=34073 RepID=UPI0021ABE453|nr:Ig-like domain-containing protein [Variovorax paradoxus]UVH60159.1 Ig-like domain-containing protein [Variovorax paradoxus]
MNSLVTPPRIPFKPMLLASALSVLLAACGGGSDGGGSFFPTTPPTTVAPPATQPPASEPDQLVSKAQFTPNAGTTEGSSDASTAFALPDGFMLVADDEANVLRVYPRAGGAAVKEWSYELEGPKLGKELDLEAGTRIGDTLYLTGSNSNKKDGSDAPDRSHLFAVKVTGTGATTAFTYVGQFSALEAQLVAWDVANGHGLGANYLGFALSAGAGIVPERVDGFSIEGMTSAPGDSALWLGFRAPQTGTSTRAKALIVPVQNYAALVAGTATQATFGAPIELELGGRGIRSIDKGTDGNYLIVAGPAGAASADVDRNFALFAWNGNPDSAPVELSNDLDKLRKNTGGSFESTVEVPGPVTAGTQVQLLLDNGDTVWPGQTDASKDLAPADQKFDGFVVRLGQPWVDTAGPVLRSASPKASDGSVGANAKITLSFNEGVRLGAGNLVLHKTDGTVVESFSASSPAASVQRAFNTITLTPSQPLASSTGYYVTVDANAITDAKDNAYAGIADATTLSFTTSAPPALAAGDILFVGANADKTDAFAFVLLKPMDTGTNIVFTDRDRTATDFNGITNESAFVWTADRSLPAGTIVTIQPDVKNTNPIANIGTVQGAGGGISASYETIYAFVGGTIAGLGTGTAGTISGVGTYLASITLGPVPNSDAIPTSLTAAGAAISFVDKFDVLYNGPMLPASPTSTDIANFAASVKNTANWKSQSGTGWPLTNNSLF